MTETASSNTVENTQEQIEDLINGINDIDLRDEYIGVSIDNVSIKDIKRIHGVGTGGMHKIKENEIKSIDSILLVPGKLVDYSMFRVVPAGSSLNSITEEWKDSSGSQMMSIHPEIQKYIDSESKKGNYIKLCYSGEFAPKSTDPSPSTKILAESVGKKIKCSVYLKSSRRYTFIGILKLHQVQKIKVKIGDEMVEQRIFHFV